MRKVHPPCSTWASCALGGAWPPVRAGPLCHPHPAAQDSPDCGGFMTSGCGLAHCQEEAAEFDAATPRRRPARRADRGPAPPRGPPAPLAPPAGFRCYAVRDIRSIGEQSGRTTGLLGSTGHVRASCNANHAPGA